MSHYTVLKTCFKDLSCLREALKTLGIETQKSETPVKLRDYSGRLTENAANLVAKREQWVGCSCADLGWHVDATGVNSQSYVDEYQNPRIRALGGITSFTRKVAQEYAVAALSKNARAKGKVVHRVECPDGKVKVYCNV